MRRRGTVRHPQYDESWRDGLIGPNRCQSCLDFIAINAKGVLLCLPYIRGWAEQGLILVVRLNLLSGVLYEALCHICCVHASAIRVLTMPEECGQLPHNDSN